MGATVKNAIESVPSISSGMSFRAPLKELARALAMFARVADKRSSLPILANVALRVDENGATLVATDLYTTLTLHVPEWRGERGDFTVPAKQLSDIVKKLPGTEVSIARTGQGLRVEAGGVDTVLLGIPGRDYPKLPMAVDLSFSDVDGPIFRSLIERVLPSVCLDETRFHLNGIHLHTDGDLVRMVSTDGHRLALAQAPKSDIGANGFYSEGVIVPAKGAKEIAKLIQATKQATCSIALNTTHLFVRCGGFEIATKLIDAKFPPYWQVIPQAHEKLVTVERAPLLTALKRAKSLTSETRGVRFDVASGKLKLTSDHPDSGTATESMKAESLWIDDGGSITIGFNPKYLIDALAAIECRLVTLAFGNELDPALVRSTDDAVSFGVRGARFLCVVMPMRI